MSDIGTAVKEMMVTLSGSGSVAELEYDVCEAATTCEPTVIDFEGYDRTTYITNQYQPDLLTVSCTGTYFGCRIFDTAVPYGWTSGNCASCTLEYVDPANDAVCGDNNVLKDLCGDPALGSPNKLCATPGYGVGAGGEPGSAYANCDALGKVMIIDENGPWNPPDDSKSGGEMTLAFAQPVEVNHLKFLDNVNTGTIKIDVSTMKSAKSNELGIPSN